MPTDTNDESITNRRSEPTTVVVLTRQDLLELAYGGGSTGDTRNG